MISQHVFFKQAAFSSFLILHVEGIAELYTWGLSCFLFINFFSILVKSNKAILRWYSIASGDSFKQLNVTFQAFHSAIPFCLSSIYSCFICFRHSVFSKDFWLKSPEFTGDFMPFLMLFCIE